MLEGGGDARNAIGQLGHHQRRLAATLPLREGGMDQCYAVARTALPGVIFARVCAEAEDRGEGRCTSRRDGSFC